MGGAAPHCPGSGAGGAPPFASRRRRNDHRRSMHAGDHHHHQRGGLATDPVCPGTGGLPLRKEAQILVAQARRTSPTRTSPGRRAGHRGRRGGDRGCRHHARGDDRRQAGQRLGAAGRHGLHVRRRGRVLGIVDVLDSHRDAHDTATGLQPAASDEQSLHAAVSVSDTESIEYDHGVAGQQYDPDLDRPAGPIDGQ
jgi:hypothetical protein